MHDCQRKWQGSWILTCFIIKKGYIYVCIWKYSTLKRSTYTHVSSPKGVFDHSTLSRTKCNRCVICVMQNCAQDSTSSRKKLNCQAAEKGNIQRSLILITFTLPDLRRSYEGSLISLVKKQIKHFFFFFGKNQF